MAPVAHAVMSGPGVPAPAAPPERRSAETDWQGPGAPERRRAAFDWRALVWGMVFPPKRHRINVTIPGLFLMALAMGIGTAAYNTASNILFITLSLLLACLLLSGLLSWFNFMGLCWRLRAPGPWRAGHETFVTAELRNGKSWLPTYGLWLDFATQPRRRPVPADAPETSVREALKAFDRARTTGRLFLRERLEPRGGAVALDWVVRPERRGEAVVELAAVGSFFPFGFLRKNLGTGLKRTVLVWPAQITYQWRGGALVRSAAQGQRTPRAGVGEDLHALRRYAPGDSHRQIHWKASARLGTLLVRQYAAESLDGFALRIDTPAAVWTRPEQFELLCSFAATLAEDLFAGGRLRGVTINGGPYRDLRRVRDLEALLDELALLEPVAEPAAGSVAPTRAPRHTLTFAPEGVRGVTAYLDGNTAATA